MLFRSDADAYFTRLAALGHNGGVLIMRDGKVLLRRSYGFADREKGIPADSATVYNIGSITKQFTAAAILRLEELGRLRVADSIGHAWPNRAGISLRAKRQYGEQGNERESRNHDPKAAGAGHQDASLRHPTPRDGFRDWR